MPDTPNGVTAAEVRAEAIRRIRALAIEHPAPNDQYDTAWNAFVEKAVRELEHIPVVRPPAMPRVPPVWRL